MCAEPDEIIARLHPVRTSGMSRRLEEMTTDDLLPLTPVQSDFLCQSYGRILCTAVTTTHRSQEAGHLVVLLELSFVYVDFFLLFSLSFFSHSSPSFWLSIAIESCRKSQFVLDDRVTTIDRPNDQLVINIVLSLSPALPEENEV